MTGPSLNCPRCTEPPSRQLTAADVKALESTSDFRARPGARVFRCNPCDIVYSVFHQTQAAPGHAIDNAGQSSNT